MQSLGETYEIRSAQILENLNCKPVEDILGKRGTTACDVQSFKMVATLPCSLNVKTQLILKL